MRDELARAPWTDEVTDCFGAIKAALERTGTRLEDLDLAVAAHALAVGPVPPESAAPDGSGAVTADDWRRKASTDCDAERWTACIADLDRARQLDPAGDEAPPVKDLRARATEGHDKPPPKKP